MRNLLEFDYMNLFWKQKTSVNDIFEELDSKNSKLYDFNFIYNA